MNPNPITRADIRIVADLQAMALQGTILFGEVARNSVNRHGRFTVAISGGSTPRAMYRLLAQEQFRTTIPWEEIHIFWVDERMVPDDDADSNFGAAKKDFLSSVPLRSSQIYPMPVKGDPLRCAANYEATLKKLFIDSHDAYPVFDLIFLGMGSDGHVASLFPDQPETDTASEWVLAVKGGNPYLDRITLSFPVLNQARQIVFLVAGRGKAEMIRTVFQKPDRHLPAQKIQPTKSKPLWLLDKDAAHLLPNVQTAP